MGPKPKRLPKELKLMFCGVASLFKIAVALVTAIWELACEIGKTDDEAVAAIHQLSQQKDKQTFRKMAEVALGVATTAVIAVRHSFAGLLVAYDQSLGLRKLIELAVGERNLGNISPDITPKRFMLAGTGVRNVKCRVEPCLAGESYEQAVARLKSHVPSFGNTGDLAGFLHDHPDEVEKWTWVAAVSEDSRWTGSGGGVYVPDVFVGGAYRYFYLVCFHYPQDSSGGVLVLCE